jgi:glycosyltransferase involved in cell wall biosynthesis
MRLIVVGPTPPPVHGVTTSTSLVLANRELRRSFEVEHLDTSDRRPLETIARWDASNVRLALAHIAELWSRLSGPRGAIYLPLSASSGGFVRDALMVEAARTRGWVVTGHLRGGEFLDLFTRSPAVARAAFRRTIRSFDSLAVLGDSLRWMFGGLIPAARLAVVPNGTTDHLVPDLPRAARPTILFLSNLRGRKGLRESVDAALLALTEEPGIDFLFAGEWENARVRSEILSRSAPAGDRIRFLDTVGGDEKRRLLSSAWALLFPPREPEGHPRVVLEALSAGLPIITTDQGTIAETVLDGVCGFVLPKPDPAALASRILTLVRDAPLRAEMSAAARARYEDRYTQARADRALSGWLEEVTARCVASRAS